MSLEDKYRTQIALLMKLTNRILARWQEMEPVVADPGGNNEMEHDPVSSSNNDPTFLVGPPEQWCSSSESPWWSTSLPVFFSASVPSYMISLPSCSQPLSSELGAASGGETDFCRDKSMTSYRHIEMMTLNGKNLIQAIKNGRTRDEFVQARIVKLSTITRTAIKHR